MKIEGPFLFLRHMDYFLNVHSAKKNRHLNQNAV